MLADAAIIRLCGMELLQLPTTSSIKERRASSTQYKRYGPGGHARATSPTLQNSSWPSGEGAANREARGATRPPPRELMGSPHETSRPYDGASEITPPKTIQHSFANARLPLDSDFASEPSHHILSPTDQATVTDTSPRASTERWVDSPDTPWSIMAVGKRSSSEAGQVSPLGEKTKVELLMAQAISTPLPPSPSRSLSPSAAPNEESSRMATRSQSADQHAVVADNSDEPTSTTAFGAYFSSHTDQPSSEIHDMRKVYIGKTIFRMAKEAYIDLDSSRLEESLIRLWNEEIRCALDAKLDEEVNLVFRSSDCYDIDLKMFGRDPSYMSPTIIIWCWSRPVFRRVKKRLKGYKRSLAFSNLPMFACVIDSQFLALSEPAKIGISISIICAFLSIALTGLSINLRRRRKRHSRALDRPQWVAQDSNHLEAAHTAASQPVQFQPRPQWNQTSNATSTRAELGSELENSKTPNSALGATMTAPLTSEITIVPQNLWPKSVSPVMLCGARLDIHTNHQSTLVNQSTLGGIIRIQRRIYGFSVGHVLLRTVPEVKPKITGDNGDNSNVSSATRQVKHWAFVDAMDHYEKSIEESSDDDRFEISSEITKEQHDSTGEIRPDLASANKTVIHSETVSPTGNQSHKKAKVFQSGPNYSQDFMIFDLTNHFGDLSNDNYGITVDFQGKTQIKGTLTDPSSIAKVTIYTAFSGTVTGNLSKTWSSIHTLDGTVSARQVLLNESLQPGDSGSWVWQDGLVCGYIIAGHRSLPLAYMRPMDDVLKDIIDSLGGISNHSEMHSPPNSELESMPGSATFSTSSSPVVRSQPGSVSFTASSVGTPASLFMKTPSTSAPFNADAGGRMRWLRSRNPA